MRYWFFLFDHLMLGDDRVFVVATWRVNAMKMDLGIEKFWKVIGEYDRYMREGGEFDRDVVGFDYWRRVRGRTIGRW